MTVYTIKKDEVHSKWIVDKLQDDIGPNYKRALKTNLIKLQN